MAETALKPFGRYAAAGLAIPERLRINSEDDLLRIASRSARPSKIEWCQSCSPSCDQFVTRGGGLLSPEWMLDAAAANKSLLKYLYPEAPIYNPSAFHTSWQPMTEGCGMIFPSPLGPSCWCFHVSGSMRKDINPKGASSCVRVDRIESCDNSPIARKNCSCIAPRESGAHCLFGDMRPLKLLAVIAACRAAGVTHIIEQGRYGGLSAALYAMHGFRVTSLELMPLPEVTSAMRALAPGVALLDGDGRRLVQSLAARIGKERTAVIFDGEKRLSAYGTFATVKHKLTLAVFDDSNLDRGEFPEFLRKQGEVAWHTWDCSFLRAHDDERILAPFSAALRKLVFELAHADSSGQGRVIPGSMVRSLDRQGRLIFHGGMEDLSRFHLSIVQGGAWRAPV